MKKSFEEYVAELNRSHKSDLDWERELQEMEAAPVDLYGDYFKNLHTAQWKGQHMPVNEKSLTRIFSKIQEYDACILTVFRKNRTPEENMKKTKMTRDIFIIKGYLVTDLVGFYRDTKAGKEESVGEIAFLVANERGHDFEEFFKLCRYLGETLEQDCILMKNAKKAEVFFYGTNKTTRWINYREKRRTLNSFGPDLFEYALSQYHDSQFVFEGANRNIERVITDLTPTTIRTIKTSDRFKQFEKSLKEF